MSRTGLSGNLSASSSSVAAWAAERIAEVSQYFLGNDEAIELCLAALLCRGHVLVEDLPGVGKTVLARTIARSVGGRFRQIQCTPDLLPSDILGVTVYHQASGSFRFREGPIVTNILLVDEINRATPRTQSALLEAMAEGQVSVESRTLILPSPFFLIATQSPLESEGTFPLPEVQKDRFFVTLRLGYPERSEERRIISDWQSSSPGAWKEQTDGESRRLKERIEELQQQVAAVHVSEGIKDYILALVGATRRDPRLLLGVSPRGSLALFKGGQALAAIAGRDWVIPEDVKKMAPPVLVGRVQVRPEHSARGVTARGVVEGLLSSVAVPGYDQGERS
jgi:MoxR-like ATPase